MKKYIIALDQGTTSSRAIVFDRNQRICASAQKSFTQIYPHPGWVEHNAMEIYSTVVDVILEAMAKCGLTASDVAALGITNQRETTVVWDRETGLPVCNAIVWQCRRTAGLCEEIKKNNELTGYIKEKTGLLVDAYFSATKLKWILDNVPGAREKAEAGRLLFGTIDTWLIWKLTGGKRHVTDYTNASRTMLFDIHGLQWDDRICRELGIPLSVLPEVYPSSSFFGEALLGDGAIPICGAAGDQQAALFGQGCFKKGEAKNTYGTGCFLLMNTGDSCTRSENGLVSTIAASVGEHISYALEGSVFVGGAVIQWLRDEMGLLRDASDSEYLAGKVEDTGGVYLVPAFTGLGAPYWDMYARGAIVGLTRGTRPEHIIRAALESIAFQSADLIKAMEKDTDSAISKLRVDGGASQNNLLMQFQSDIIGAGVSRPQLLETTALGAASLAGLEAGIWSGLDELKQLRTGGCEFLPQMSRDEAERRVSEWHRAVKCSMGWAK